MDHERRRIWRAIKMCGSKVQHDTMRAARTEAARLSAERGVALRAYECPLCGKFHLTRAMIGHGDEEEA